MPRGNSQCSAPVSFSWVFETHRHLFYMSVGPDYVPRRSPWRGAVWSGVGPTRSASVRCPVARLCAHACAACAFSRFARARGRMPAASGPCGSMAALATLTARRGCRMGARARKRAATAPRAGIGHRQVSRRGSGAHAQPSRSYMCGLGIWKKSLAGVRLSYPL